MKHSQGPAAHPFRLDFTPARRWRRSLDLTQAELASRCGVERTTIWRVERNRHEPSAGLLVAMGRAMGVPVHQLFVAVEAES